MILLSSPAFSRPAASQVISPGKLSEAHSDLEGMSNCTRCHQLRTRGVDQDRCLECHQVLRDRIREGRGYHGQSEVRDCGVCHKEHLGVDFSLIRLDADTFPHESTGYLLTGAHASADCRSCHTPELITDPELRQELSSTGGIRRTYLGLSRQCAACHVGDDPHDNQFPDRDCGTCHTEVEWEGATAFDHADSSFPLDGEHRRVECGGCHILKQYAGTGDAIRYVGLEFEDCVSCHDDPHREGMGGPCGGCHITAGWHQVNTSVVESRFRHQNTGFPLEGSHDGLPCRACHSEVNPPEGIDLQFAAGTQIRSYPSPRHDTCNSCHRDFHEGVFEERTCDACHTLVSWSPPAYPLARHQMELRFELTGAHDVTPCSGCHEVGTGENRRLVFRFDSPETCEGCHVQDDPHEGVFGIPGCDLCHQTTGFHMDRFDHERMEAAAWTGACLDCHTNDDPHGGQFPEKDCGECHEWTSYTVEEFDHDLTRFPLDGAHMEVSCDDCHKEVAGPGGRPMTQYRPLDTACTACHIGRSP